MIKKIPTKALVLILTACFSFSCNENNEVVLSQCFPIAITTLGIQFTLTYTSDNKLNRVSSIRGLGTVKQSETSDMLYNSKGNIVKVQSTGSFDLYTYNSNNKMTRADFYQDGALVGRTDYIYNSLNQLEKTQYYDILSDGTIENSDYHTLEYSSPASKNPTKAKSFTPTGSLIATHQYEYDDKRTFYNSISGLDVIFATVAAEENNVIKITRMNEGGDLQSATTFVYRYNDQGYPTQVNTTTIYTDGTNTTSSDHNYSYNCK